MRFDLWSTKMEVSKIVASVSKKKTEKNYDD